MIVTPEAVEASIEVKTGLDTPAKITEVIMKAAENKKKWKSALYGWDNYLGMFIYESRGNHDEVILRALKAAHVEYGIAPDSVVFGEDVIVEAQGQIGRRTFNGWIAKKTQGMAAALFVGNLVSYFSEETLFANRDAWQPLLEEDTKLKYLERDGDTGIEETTLAACFEQGPGEAS